MPNPTRALFYTDAYKLGHIHQYPEGTQYVFSNYTNRGVRKGDTRTHVVSFGLQAFLTWFAEEFEDFFNAPEDVVAHDYETKVEALLGPNNIGSDHIRALHKLGYLPLEFHAVREGTLVPLRVPMITIENTLPEFFWLVNYIETILSASVWQAQTSATSAFYLKKDLLSWARKTGGDIGFVDFQGHDFSFRGMSSLQSAQYSGAGHLTSFLGTDTLAAIDWVNEYYPGGGFIGGSVAATEHSVMCAGGAGPGEEEETFRRLITEVVPSGIVSVVSDTWDLWNVLTVILPNLKEEILGRDGKLVIRPDSGDPVDILTGTADYRGVARPDDTARKYAASGQVTPAHKGVIELLWETFGGTINEAGYKVLDSHIGAIYGDSITRERANQISERLEAKGFASTNVVYGVGSYTYQYVTRDTFGSAIKATWVQIASEEKQIFKDPITDSGLKKSARGRVAVLNNPDTGELYLEDHLDRAGHGALADVDQLIPIWRDGYFLHTDTFADIRARIAAQQN